MADQNEIVENLPEFLSNLYDDPVRQSTEKRGLWLCIASLATVSITVFGVEIKSIEGFPINLPDAAGTLPGLFFVIVALLLGDFVLRALTDYLRETEVRPLVSRFVLAQSLARKKADAQKTDDHIYSVDEGHQPEPWWEEYALVVEEQQKILTKLEEKLGDRKFAQFLRALRLFLHIIAPIVLGLLAIAVARHHFFDFSNSIYSAIIS